MSHQTATINGIPNIATIVRRKVCSVLAVKLGGMGIAIVSSRDTAA